MKQNYGHAYSIVAAPLATAVHAMGLCAAMTLAAPAWAEAYTSRVYSPNTNVWSIGAFRSDPDPLLYGWWGVPEILYVRGAVGEDGRSAMVDTYSATASAAIVASQSGNLAWAADHYWDPPLGPPKTKFPIRTQSLVNETYSDANALRGTLRSYANFGSLPGSIDAGGIVDQHTSDRYVPIATTSRLTEVLSVHVPRSAACWPRDCRATFRADYEVTVFQAEARGTLRVGSAILMASGSNGSTWDSHEFFSAGNSHETGALLVDLLLPDMTYATTDTVNVPLLFEMTTNTDGFWDGDIWANAWLQRPSVSLALGLTFSEPRFLSDPDVGLPPAPIPEPSAALMLSVGTIIIAFVVIRRRTLVCA